MSLRWVGYREEWGPTTGRYTMFNYSVELVCYGYNAVHYQPILTI